MHRSGPLYFRSRLCPIWTIQSKIPLTEHGNRKLHQANPTYTSAYLIHALGIVGQRGVIFIFLHEYLSRVLKNADFQIKCLCDFSFPKRNSKLFLKRSLSTSPESRDWKFWIFKLFNQKIFCHEWQRNQNRIIKICLQDKSEESNYLFSLSVKSQTQQQQQKQQHRQQLQQHQLLAN